MDKRKAYLIENLFKLSDEYILYKELFEKFFTLLQKKYTDIKIDQFKETEKKFGMKFFLADVVKIYDNYFSEEEIKQLINFYNSDLGKKIKNISFRKNIAKAGEEFVKTIDKELQNISYKNNIKES
ncbi:MAG TPA: DUF2059 domain-containing protein [Candidatus Paceibacterota bacterium]|nr:DUF2059 domain-containing protein [Candidatus Paceibacterota bacterium]